MHDFDHPVLPLPNVEVRRAIMPSSVYAVAQINYER